MPQWLGPARTVTVYQCVGLRADRKCSGGVRACCMSLSWDTQCFTLLTIIAHHPKRPSVLMVQAQPAVDPPIAVVVHPPPAPAAPAPAKATSAAEKPPDTGQPLYAKPDSAVVVPASSAGSQQQSSGKLPKQPEAPEAAALDPSPASATATPEGEQRSSTGLRVQLPSPVKSAGQAPPAAAEVGAKLLVYDACRDRGVCEEPCVVGWAFLCMRNASKCGRDV